MHDHSSFDSDGWLTYVLSLRCFYKQLESVPAQLTSVLVNIDKEFKHTRESIGMFYAQTHESLSHRSPCVLCI